jgi:predicted ester cyclase
VRATLAGTHRAEFLGIAATNRKITVPMGDYVRFSAGQVAEHWGVTDTGTMMEQLTGD